MWVFLSRRLRSWLLLAVAVPTVHAIVRRLAAAEQSRNADSLSAKALTKADSGLARISRRVDRRR